MGALYGQRVTVGQAQGPDVELIVYGDEFYARYETPDGYPVVYDTERGQFSYARLDEGRFISTGVPATAPPPPGIVRHAQEDPERAPGEGGAPRGAPEPPTGRSRGRARGPRRRTLLMLLRAPHGTTRRTPPRPGARHRNCRDQGRGMARRAGRRAVRIEVAGANFLLGEGWCHERDLRRAGDVRPGGRG